MHAVSVAVSEISKNGQPVPVPVFPNLDLKPDLTGLQNTIDNRPRDVHDVDVWNLQTTYNGIDRREGERKWTMVQDTSTMYVFFFFLFSFYFTIESFRLLTMTTTASTGGKGQGNGHDDSPRDVNVNSWYVFFPPFFILFTKASDYLQWQWWHWREGRGKERGMTMVHDDGPRNVSDVDISCTLRVFPPFFHSILLTKASDYLQWQRQHQQEGRCREMGMTRAQEMSTSFTSHSTCFFPLFSFYFTNESFRQLTYNKNDGIDRREGAKIWAWRWPKKRWCAARPVKGGCLA